MEDLNMALEALRAFLVQVGGFLPKLMLALLIVLGGWLLAKAARVAIVKGLRAINFHVLAERAGLDGLLQQGPASTDTTAIVGLLVYWLAILAALILAFNSLGLANVAELLERIAWFMPKVILAVVIIAFGAYFAGFIGGAVAAYGRTVGLRDEDLLGRVARYAVLVFVVLIALDQLDIAGSIIRDSFLVILAGLVFALALAFGLGGRKWAAALLERWWPMKQERKHDD